MSSKNETRKPETKLPKKDKDVELQVEELEERIAPIALTPGKGR
jgi:hypothetical protein